MSRRRPVRSRYASPASPASRTPRASRTSRTSRAFRTTALVITFALPATALAGCATPDTVVPPRAGLHPSRTAAPRTLFPTGPAASFTTVTTLADGTKIRVTDLHGAKSGFTGKVWVWTPKQYSDPAYAKSGFPVLISLPGSYGYPANYWKSTHLGFESNVARWSEQGKSVPFIVVMPVLNPNNKHYYDGSDIPGQPKMGTWLTEDVPDFVRTNFRTFQSRDGWAFMGSSSGGFAALKSVLQKPDKFKAAIASGPDTVPDSPLWKGYEEEREANDPEELATALARKPDIPANRVYLAFQIGTQETGIMESLKDFIRTYTNKGPVKSHLQVIEGGAHNARSYMKGMDEGTIAWISQYLQGPIPASS
ncbi:alpha/beta hydrolase-fold protein [Streptomyces sp. NPDC046203]|uniref:alpha/beta hydrolase n=1 Tax=Streptomyces sp. NPDC046203 TaxID=3154602 RepID=UPI0034070758